MATMLFGWLALATLIISGSCLYCKRPFWSFLSSVGTMVLVYFTGYSWKLMLIASGKDTTLLGFDRYPATLVILSILSIFAAAGMIVSVIYMVRKKHKHQK